MTGLGAVAAKAVLTEAGLAAVGAFVLTQMGTAAPGGPSFTIAVVAVVASLVTAAVSIGAFVLTARRWVVSSILENVEVRDQMDKRAEHKAADAAMPVTTRLDVLADGLGALRTDLGRIHAKLDAVQEHRSRLDVTLAKIGADLAGHERLLDQLARRIDGEWDGRDRRKTAGT